MATGSLSLNESRAEPIRGWSTRLRGQHGLQLLQGQRLSGGDGERQRRRDHARGQDDVGPGPGYDQGGVAGVATVVLGCLVVPEGEPRLGWPKRQLNALDLPQGPLDLAQGALDQDWALAQPRNVLVQQERALRGRRGERERDIRWSLCSRVR